MHILFITDNFPPEVNANARIVAELTQYWIKSKHEVTVITCAPNFPEGRLLNGYQNKWYQVEDYHGVRVIRVKTFIYANKGVVLRIFDFVSFMFASFFAGLMQRQVDVVIAISPQFFTTVSGLAIAKLKRRKFLFMLCDLWPASIEAVGAINNKKILKLIEKLELFTYKYSSKIIALTHAFKRDLMNRGIAENKIEVIINGVDTNHLFPSPKNSELLDKYEIRQEFVVSYIGTFGMAHALSNVIEAAKLLQTHTDIIFLLVGAGAENDKIMRLKNELKLTNVIIEGLQPKELIPRYWSITDLALIHLKDHPVFTTVLPSKMFEACAMGKPLLYAGPTGEASDLINSHQVGVCIPAEQPQFLAQAILALKKDQPRLAGFAQNAITLAQTYSREQQANKILELFYK